MNRAERTAFIAKHRVKEFEKCKSAIASASSLDEVFEINTYIGWVKGVMLKRQLNTLSTLIIRRAQQFGYVETDASESAQ